jgi:hypothetical protein
MDANAAKGASATLSLRTPKLLDVVEPNINHALEGREYYRITHLPSQCLEKGEFPSKSPACGFNRLSAHFSPHMDALTRTQC